MRYGLKIAKLFGKKLPAYSSQADAERDLFAFRDNRLQRLSDFASASDMFEPDSSPESLKSLEVWYFELWEDNAFESLHTKREEFEECMAMYFGNVIVKNMAKAEWIVSEYAFEKGKYEIGVAWGSGSIMLFRFTDHYNTPNNKRHQSIWRKFNHYST
ncbi:hypothetical protein ACXWTF_07650 [Thiomicrolovo sp. ZZH C-3]